MKASASVIRFLLEAGFLILIAACAGIAHLNWYEIIIVMAVAWALVALVERTASRGVAAAGGSFGHVLSGDEEEGAAEPTAPAAVGRRRIWRPRPEPELRAPVAATPSHVTVLAADRAPAAEEEAVEPRPIEAPDSVEVPASTEPVVSVAAAELVARQEPPPPGEKAPQPETPPEPDPEPRPEPGQAPEPKPELEPKPVPEPEPVPVPPELRAVPTQPPSPIVPEVVPPAVAQIRSAVIPLTPRVDSPREWNLWDLERIAREEEGQDSARDEERSFLLLNLRQFASSDGILSESFDELVREAFAGSLAGRR